MNEGDHFGRIIGNRKGQSIRVECEGGIKEIKAIVCVASTCGGCKQVIMQMTSGCVYMQMTSGCVYI